MFEPEQFFNKSEEIIRHVNDIISNFVEEDDESFYINPLKGNCAFGSGYFGWGFTITGTAQKLAEKTGVSAEQMSKILWGDYFYDEETKGFSNMSKGSNKNLTRGFNKILIQPIMNLYNAILENNKDMILKVCKRQEIPIKDSDFEVSGKDLLKRIFKRWINIADATLDMIC